MQSKIAPLTSGHVRSVYDLSPVELDEFEVSSISKYRDVHWCFPNSTPGSVLQQSTIHWDMLLFDGSRLNHSRHRNILDWVKKLVLTLFESPAKGRAPAPGSMSHLEQEIKVLISYFVCKDFEYPSEFDRVAAEVYIDELPSFLAHRHKKDDFYRTADFDFRIDERVCDDESECVESPTRNDDDEIEDEEVGESRFVSALTLLARLWEQRTALQRFNIAPLPDHPLGGSGVISVARSLATRARGWVLPLPDEVAVPLFNKSASLLGVPADDVIRLLQIVNDPDAGAMRTVSNGRGGKRLQKSGESDQARRKRSAIFVEAFKFGAVEGADTPWHPELRFDSDDDFSPYVRIMQLWSAVRTASCALVLGISGMRPCELAGIKYGIDAETALPRGIRIEKGLKGLYEWFVIRTELTKAQEGFARNMDWVLGMRPAGSTEIPLAVKALLVLNKLYEPWRQNSNSELLILSAATRGTLPRRSTQLQPISNKRLASSMKDFLENWVDLSGLADSGRNQSNPGNLIAWRESKGRIFTMTMLRKSWASYVLACNPKLIPVIQLQFHHVSLATTEGSYIGNNPVLLESLDSVGVQKRNQMIFDLVNKNQNVAGKMGDTLEQELQSLREKCGPLPPSERWKSVVQWCDANQLHMYFAPHASCLPIKTSNMRCHNAVNTPIWIRKNPNYPTREPSLCAGCDCAIMDKSHEQFWKDRYRENSMAIKEINASNRNLSSFREIKFRADQAKGVLRKFGSDIPVLHTVSETV